MPRTSVATTEGRGRGNTALEFPHRASFAGADFLVSTSNEAAVAWLDRWPDWPGPGLALYGPPGCGKSHLADVWRLKSGAVVLDGVALPECSPADLVRGAGAFVL